MARVLFVPRIQRCAPRLTLCTACLEQVISIHFDCDLLGRVCLGCAETGGVSQIELHKAGIFPPDPALTKANP